ncbi:hypothetical protein NW759_007556 [Fusarium solani]|nr:hypothetical protein NW759_007556 [Fusarium solani]
MLSTDTSDLNPTSRLQTPSILPTLLRLPCSRRFLFSFESSFAYLAARSLGVFTLPLVLILVRASSHLGPINEGRASPRHPTKTRDPSTTPPPPPPHSIHT